MRRKTTRRIVIDESAHGRVRVDERELRVSPDMVERVFGGEQKADSRVKPHDVRIKTVLMLEDDPGVAEVVTRLLERQGIKRIIHVVDGENALRIFQHEREGIDLVLSDRRVWGLQGDEFVALVKRISPLTPIMMMTGAYKDRDFPIDGYVEKPFPIDKFAEEIERMRRILQERRSWSESQIVDFVSKTAQTGDKIDESVIGLSSWSSPDAKAYREKFRRFGLKPILAYNPNMPLAMTEGGGFAIVNLAETNGPPSLLIPAGEYIAAHEAMEMHVKNGRVSSDNSLFDLRAIDATGIRFMINQLTAAETAHEVMVDSAVTQHFGGRILSDGYCRLLENDLKSAQTRDATDCVDLSVLAYRQVVTDFQSRVAAAPVGERLRRLSDGYRKTAESLMRDDARACGSYAELVDRYGRIFQSTRVNAQAIREFERAR